MHKQPRLSVKEPVAGPAPNTVGFTATVVTRIQYVPAVSETGIVHEYEPVLDAFVAMM